MNTFVLERYLPCLRENRLKEKKRMDFRQERQRTTRSLRRNGTLVRATIVAIEQIPCWMRRDHWSLTLGKGTVTREVVWSLLYEVTAQWEHFSQQCIYQVSDSIWSHMISRKPRVGEVVHAFVDPIHPERAIIDFASFVGEYAGENQAGGDGATIAKITVVLPGLKS